MGIGTLVKAQLKYITLIQVIVGEKEFLSRAKALPEILVHEL